MPKARPAKERFWEKVNKDGPIPSHRSDLGPCWLWTACLNEKGYGSFHVSKGHTVLAHRFLLKAIPGLESDHLCRNHACVRPSHIEQVTHAVNNERKRGLYLKQACSRGHLMTGENVRISHGERVCRACKRDDARNRYRTKHSLPPELWRGPRRTSVLDDDAVATLPT